MKAKEILLLILIIVTGVFFYHAQTGKIHIDWDLDGHFFFIHLEEFIYEESQEIEPPFPPELQINNAHGEIEIQGTEEEKITISFQKIIQRKNEEQAKEISDKLKMIVDKNELQLSISTNRNEFRRKNFETNFRISVPLGMDVKVNNSYGLVKTSKVGNTNIINRHGKIIASDIRGELILQNSYKDVEVENVQSNCRIESKHSNVFINDVQGKTSVEHRYGKIHLENTFQNVEIKSSHSEVFGQNLMGKVEVVTSYRDIALYDVGPTKITGSHSNVEVDGAKGSLDIKHRYGKVKLNNIQGNLYVEGKSIGIYGRTIVCEKIFVSSSYRTVELVEFSGKTDILLSHGDIVLEPSLLTHSIEVKGQYADIIFYWPSGGKYPFEAQAKSGDIKWKLPFELSSQEENGVSTIKAFTQEKEKPSIFLSTSYGTIRIEE